MKKLALLLLMAASGSVFGGTWTNVAYPNGLTIKNYSWFWDGNSTIIQVQVNEPITTNGCAPSDYNATTNKSPRFSHWYSGAGVNTHTQNTLSILAAAEAQGKKIDIYWHNTCDPIVGRQIWGIRINSGQ